ncbi:MAG: hypothetical protein ACFCU9_06445 [Cyanophyceae cyanobacterium]
MSAPDLAMTATLSLALTVSPQAELPLPAEVLMLALAESPFLRLAAEGEVADITIQAEANQVYRLQRPGDSVAMAAFRIPVKRARALPLKLQRILEQVAVFGAIAALTPPSDVLSSVLRTEFLQLVEPATRQSEPGVAPLVRSEAEAVQIKSGQWLAITLTNLTDAPLFAYVVVMDPRQQAVTLVYPYTPDMPARIRPGETIVVGSGPRYLIEMGLPEGQTQATDIFKLWVSGQSIQPAVLELPSLGQPYEPSTDPYGSGSRLDRDLRRLITGKSGMTPLPSFETDPWWCQSQSVEILA